MSYQLYFIKKQDLELEEVEQILESDGQESDDFYISKDLMLDIKKRLIQKGLHFESLEEGEDIDSNKDSSSSKWWEFWK